MLKIDGLTYKFGKKAAVDCLSFEFTNGVYGLLGPNGSGKTTLMRCITGLYNVKGEHIFYNGKPVEKDKSFFAPCRLSAAEIRDVSAPDSERNAAAHSQHEGAR